MISKLKYLQHELVNIDNLEYTFHDETLVEIGVSPDEAELPIPKFIVHDREKEILYWEEQMTRARAKLEQADVLVSWLSPLFQIA